MRVGAAREALIIGDFKLNHMLPSLPNHIMTLIFGLFCSQELYQSTEQVHSQLSELERIFPDNAFLKTQRALLFHHSKGLSNDQLHAETRHIRTHTHTIKLTTWV